MPITIPDQMLDEIEYKSMADYIRRMDELDNFDDKMAFTTRYLLSHGNKQRDVSFAEAVHIAKMKIAEASAKIRENEIMIPDEAVNPHATDEEDAPNRMFMIDPAHYLLNEANNLLMGEINKGERANQKLVQNYEEMSGVLMNGYNNSLPAEISELDIEPNARDVKARLTARFGGKKQFEKAYNATKPGFFAKMFGKYSKAYSNLDQAYQAFNNPNHALYGNMNSLDKAATEYLQHLFPKWDPKKGIISKSSIERLSGSKKDRGLFCLNILKSTAEQRKVEKVYDPMISANIQKRADLEANASDEVLENNNSFQENILKDIDEKKELDSSQAERDYHANFEDVPEPAEDEPNLE